MFTIHRHTVILFVSTFLVVTVMFTTAIPMQVPSTTITVSGMPWGLSTCYIGATEGNVRFDIADLRGAGITTYRIYGGMHGWEWQDDDGVYGAPTIVEIKANPNVINWTWWDTAMTNPPHGSDYWWSGKDHVWQGDAIRDVYDPYLPGRTFHVYAPVTGGSRWPRDVMVHAGASFDTMDVHNYNADITGYTKHMHGWMNQYGKADAELWLSEWATYLGGYQSASTGVNTVLNNLIRGARPGHDHIDGSHLFTFYDWDGSNGGSQHVDWSTFQGLVGPTGTRLASFYTFRMGIRALNRCKTTYQSTTSDSHVLAITTKDAEGTMYLLVTNSSSETFYNVNADLSALITSGTGTMWQFDAMHNDVIVGHPTLSNGHVTFTIPGTAAILITF